MPRGGERRTVAAVLRLSVALIGSLAILAVGAAPAAACHPVSLDDPSGYHHGCGGPKPGGEDDDPPDGDSKVGPPPPRPVVVSHGARRRAAQGSWCGNRACVTRGVPRTRRSVPVHPGVRVRILLKDAAQEITLRTTGSDRRYAEATMDGDDGTRWSFRMPDRRDLPTDLLLDIEYEHSGHGLFGVRLAAHEHSSS